MPSISLSSGWLFTHDDSSLEQQKQYIDLVDGVELSITRDERFSTYDSPIECKRLSFHISQNYDHVDRVSKLYDRHNPDAVVIHSDAPQRVFKEYENHNIPLSIENMDSRKQFGHGVEVRNVIEEFNTTFTLDIQHAYEHDETMEYAWELVSMAGDYLAELHVSGETANEIHALVHKADNRETILQFLEKFYIEHDYNTPLVIEGKYKTQEDVKNEIDLLERTINK